MIKKVLRVVRDTLGELPPATQGVVRGLVAAAVLAGLGAVVDNLGHIGGGPLAYLAPIAIAAIRAIEGVVDEKWGTGA